MTFYESASLIVIIAGMALVYFKKTAIVGWLCLPLFFAIQVAAVEGGEKEWESVIFLLFVWVIVFSITLLGKHKARVKKN